MLQFKFTPGGEGFPFAMEVEVYEIIYDADVKPRGVDILFVSMPAPKLVGNLAIRREGDEFEVWNMLETGDGLPVHYLEKEEDFASYVMYQIPEAAWLGVR